MSSDHYPGWASVDGRDFKLKTRVRQISVTGWQPCNEVGAEKFRVGVLRKLGLQHGIPTYGHLPDMSAVQEHILDSSLAVSFTTKPMRKREHFAKPPQLAAAEEASKRAPAGPQKAACRKLERQLRRRWKAKLVDLELSDKVKQTKVQGLHSLECHGIQTSDRLQWVKELGLHCLQKYYFPYETSAVQHARIQALRSVQAASELDGRRAPELTPGVVLLARGRMATGKAPGVDRVVVEMSHLLLVTLVFMIASILAKRYSGECVESIDSWGQILMVFLAKVSSPKELARYRGISLLSVMGKWYMSCLVILAQASPKPAAWRHVCVFGYVTELSTVHITAGLQLLMARGREWEGSSPVYVLNADMKAAFDNMGPDTIAISLHRAQQHPRITAAMVQEMARLSCLPELEGITLEEPTVFNKCARQGGMESTYQWNCVMYMCFCALVPVWNESGYGIRQVLLTSDMGRQHMAAVT